jgi:predicted aspartyl protease
MVDARPLSADSVVRRVEMGITHVEGTVTGVGGRQAVVMFMVDSGATYTLLPLDVWQAIGLAPSRTMTFSLADGTHIRRNVSECHISLPQGQGHTPVVLGEPGDEALLGIVTLEILGLVLDPFTRQLRPMRMRLA